MLNIVNDFLNKTTMYKVLIYGLLTLAFHGIGMTALDILSFDLVLMVLTLFVFVFSCYVFNIIISNLLGIATNIESALITGLILFLIIQPASSPFDLLAIFLISIFAMASKYILVANKIHIFNPAALAALISGALLNYYATWWVGSQAMLPLVLIIGFLIVKKVRRFGMASLFILTALLSALLFNSDQNLDFPVFISQIFTSWPIVFFAAVMLTEPLTMPGVKKLQLMYAFLVGVLFGARFNLGSIYSTPELALIIGNLAFFILHPRNKYILTLKEKIQLSPDIYEFVFSSDKKIGFRPGQYIEWTLPHEKPDSRGNRRFFTIASSPTEDDIKIGVRMNKDSSSFKSSLQNMNIGNHLCAAQVAGDFTLDQSRPSVFIAGGIGITPFRSMVKYLTDMKIKYDVTLFYFAKSEQDFVFKDVFEAAGANIGVKTHYIVSGSNTDLEKLIKDNVLDYSSRKYYLSGPNAMVDSYKKIINKLGIRMGQIVTDYFPGF